MANERRCGGTGRLRGTPQSAYAVHICPGCEDCKPTEAVDMEQIRHIDSIRQFCVEIYNHGFDADPNDPHDFDNCGSVDDVLFEFSKLAAELKEAREGGLAFQLAFTNQKKRAEKALASQHDAEREAGEAKEAYDEASAIAKKWIKRGDDAEKELKELKLCLTQSKQESTDG